MPEEQIIEEGSARIKLGEGVFYNPKMERLRSISVLFLKAAMPNAGKVLDATTATGIRGIRYALEANAQKVTMLDTNPNACRLAEANIKMNGLEGRVNVVNTSLQKFANNNSAEKFDVIDIDPFGTPAPFIYDAMKLCKSNTLMLITATDTATLCGAEGNACLRIYSSVPARNELCHEASIRILLAFTARIAAQFGFGIEPLLSLSELHYVRIFIKLNKGAKQAVESVKKIGYASSCSKCHAYYYEQGQIPKLSSTCKYCGNATTPFGPLWLSSIYDKSIVKGMLNMCDSKNEQIRKTLLALTEEADIPFFYNIDKVCEYIGTGSVSKKQVIENLESIGYIATPTVFGKNSIKTNASISELIDAIKSHVGKDARKS